MILVFLLLRLRRRNQMIEKINKINEVSKKDPSLMALEIKMKGRQLELQKKYPIKVVGLSSGIRGEKERY